ncbi:hypothetical protein LIER_42539 [Lithospermum erythrorhizon]|uniref:Uncharacterized protein n=1 Tax=Lithospermum erythrorhizon TaxID=34254 RepID=A0AAV3NL96_LITER
MTRLMERYQFIQPVIQPIIGLVFQVVKSFKFLEDMQNPTHLTLVRIAPRRICTWARWKNVNTTTQDRLWNNFKNYFDIEVEESTAKYLFFKQASLWYWRSMGEVIKEALESAKMEDVMDLLGKPKLPWMQTQAVWDSFVKYWIDPNTIKKSNSAKKSPETEGAGRHGLGNVSLKTRMRKQEEKIRVRPSSFEILLEQN